MADPYDFDIDRLPHRDVADPYMDEVPPGDGYRPDFKWVDQAPSNSTGSPVEPDPAPEPGVLIDGVEDTSIWRFVTSHPAEFITGFTAVVIVIFLVEFVKPWVRTLYAHRGWSEKAIERTLKTMPYFFGAMISGVFDFSQHWHSLTQHAIDPWSGFLIGTFMTGGLAQLSYNLTKEFRVIEAIRLRWYRFMGVTNEDIEELRKQSTPSRDPHDEDPKDFEADEEGEEILLLEEANNEDNQSP